jgi:hypothetical protein
MKNVLFWAQILMVSIGFMFCGIGMVAVDEWLVYDWQSISPQKTSLLAGLAGAFALCFLVWSFGSLVERLFEGMRARDPDYAYDFESEDGVFPSSPRKPR